MSSTDACAANAVGSALVFDQEEGFRHAISPLTDTRFGAFLRFMIRIGGGNCEEADGLEESIIVAYSTNGGSFWYPLEIVASDSAPSGKIGERCVSE